MHACRGLAFAHLGRTAEAIAEGRRGLELTPLGRDALSHAAAQHRLARIYLLVGEPERALDELEALLKLSYNFTPPWLRIDPTVAPLKGNPRLEKMIAGR